MGIPYFVKTTTSMMSLSIVITLCASSASSSTRAAFSRSPMNTRSQNLPPLRRNTLFNYDPWSPQSVRVPRISLDSSLSSSSSNSETQTPKQSRRRPRSSQRKRALSKNDNLSSGGPQTWRVFGVMVHPDDLLDPIDEKAPIDKRYLAPAVLEALTKRLKIRKDPDLQTQLSDPTQKYTLPSELADIRVVRKSLDARKKRRLGEQQGPRFAYVLDVDVSSNIAQQLRFKHQPGRMERMKQHDATKQKAGATGIATSTPKTKDSYKLTSATEEQDNHTNQKKTRVVVIGAGPAGLFCALTLARSGKCTPILLERGQAVESRGKDIGALMHRRLMNEDSNFAFGEGGAGTWSDGKLTTRIGRNSNGVRSVLETLVEYGAPEKILVDGAPHLGTDNLVKLLRNMRLDLRRLGGEVRFGAKVTDVYQHDGVATGVNVEYTQAVERTLGIHPPLPQYEGSERIIGDAVVLATGHSARDVYESLHASGVQLEAKGFAAGFRVEHPQSLINDIQYGKEWGPTVITKNVRTDKSNEARFVSFDKEELHDGTLPVPSYRLATDKAYDGDHSRGVYSFCMCPGGQIVPASKNPEEVCVNGMSFSRRNSLWANSAMVVTVSPDDEILEEYREEHGVLAGIAFQRDMERRASNLGGGNLTVPVQRLTDFVDGRVSSTVPSSSYRLGIKSAPCHELYPAPMTAALRDAVVNHFEKQMPGFLSEEALLHGVETRTSSPVRVARDSESLQAIGIKRLFPTGEGAGFAGGIVSAAVDGLVVAEAVLEELHKGEERSTDWKSEKKSVGFNY